MDRSPDGRERGVEDRGLRIDRSPAALVRNGLVVVAWTALLAWLFARRSYPEPAFYALGVGALVFYLILLTSVDRKATGGDRPESNQKG
jgi:hypothetical protein